MSACVRSGLCASGVDGDRNARRCIRTGTGGGLKSLWPQGRVGSNPTTATSKIEEYGVLLGYEGHRSSAILVRRVPSVDQAPQSTNPMTPIESRREVREHG